MALQIPCKTCSTAVRVKPSMAARRKNIFCSPPCYHASLRHPRRDVAERFWSKVHKTDTCWLWTGGKHPQGYGMFNAKLNGRLRAVTAHWFAFTMAGAPLSNFEEGDHFCPNKNCVRIHPEHVQRVPRFDNHDSPSYENKIKTLCKRGHALTTRKDNGERRCRTCENAGRAERRKQMTLEQRKIENARWR